MKKHLIVFLLFQLSSPLLFSQRQMESLDRGLIAVKENGHFYVGWRVFGTDSDNLAFNLYRKTGTNKAILVNNKPITGATNLIDTNANPNEVNTWFVKTVLNGIEKEAKGSFSIPAHSPEKNYLSITLKAKEGYSPNDVSVGDLDGDGRYDLIVHMTMGRN